MTPVPKVQMPIINQNYPVPQALSVPNIAQNEQMMNYQMQQQPPLTPAPQFPPLSSFPDNVFNQQQQQQQYQQQQQQMPQQINEVRDDNQYINDDIQDSLQSPEPDDNYEEYDPLALTPNFFYDGDEYDQPYDPL